MDQDIEELLLRDFEQVQVLRDRRNQVLAFLAIHDTRAGPAFGGIRRFPYERAVDGLADALRLARAMTLKCAITGVPGGGGKTTIVAHKHMDREAAYRLVGEYVEAMGGRYYTGADVGTEPEDLATVAKATRFVAAPGPAGPGNLAQPTALGVFACISRLADRLERGLEGLHVTLQGLGAVGWRLAELLCDVGARLTVADVRREATERAADELGAEVAPVAEIVGMPADVFAPCALGGVIHPRVVDSLQVRGVCGSANNILSVPEAGSALWRRGILYAPDFLANSGALVHGALFHLEGQAPPPERICELGDRAGDILDRARIDDRPPESVALDQAWEQLDGLPTRPYFPR